MKRVFFLDAVERTAHLMRFLSKETTTILEKFQRNRITHTVPLDLTIRQSVCFHTPQKIHEWATKDLELRNRISNTVP